jgi:hypothetical protein
MLTFIERSEGGKIQESSMLIEASAGSRTSVKSVGGCAGIGILIVVVAVDVTSLVARMSHGTSSGVFIVPIYSSISERRTGKGGLYT